MLCRGNTLARLNRYADAIVDYEAASNRFIELRDVPRYSDARADLALALYEVGRTDEAVKVNNAEAFVIATLIFAKTLFHCLLTSTAFLEHTMQYLQTLVHV